MPTPPPPTLVCSFLPAAHLQVGGAWGYIRTIHRAAHLTIAVSANTATDLIDAGACDPKALKVGGCMGDRPGQCVVGLEP